MNEKINKTLETEYKSLLTEQEYNRTEENLKFVVGDPKVYTQINHFFDTEDALLDQLGITLRLRHKNDKFILQAKIKQNDDTTIAVINEEREIELTESESELLLSGETSSLSWTWQSLIGDHPKILSNHLNLLYLGFLKTTRKDFHFYTDTLSLDINEYNGVTDYEFEWETTNHHFVTYLNKSILNLTFANGNSKRKRFLSTC